MTNKYELIININKIHTTLLGKKRVQKNLLIEEDVIEFCKKKIKDSKCKISLSGKNWYCDIDDIIITINAHSYTIITAHLKGKK